MRWLLYAIAGAHRASRASLPPGLEGARLFAMGQGPLAAILAPVSEEVLRSPGPTAALAYARIVGELHRRMTVLPMRFGSIVIRRSDVAAFLRRHERELADALARVEGCDEMGVRILLPHPAAQSGEGAAASVATAVAPGTAYLASRRAFYDRRAAIERLCRSWGERAEADFAGLFRSSSWEHAVRPEGRLVSLSFLVERPNVAAFRRAFRTFRERSSARTICTGPWPPWSFAAGLRDHPPASAAPPFLAQQKG